MRVAGVDLPAGAVARLALCLRDAGEMDLSHRVGVAVDANRGELPLDTRERAAALRAIDTCPAALVELRVALVLDEVARRRATMRRLGAELHRHAAVAERHGELFDAACEAFQQARGRHERATSPPSRPLADA